MSSNFEVLSIEVPEASAEVNAGVSAAGAEVAAGGEPAHEPPLRRSVRQGPLAHETLTQLMKHVSEYRLMVSSGIASLLRKFQNRMSFVYEGAGERVHACP